jgi:hypothetical protein
MEAEAKVTPFVSLEIKSVLSLPGWGLKLAATLSRLLISGIKL